MLPVCSPRTNRPDWGQGMLHRLDDLPAGAITDLVGVPANDNAHKASFASLSSSDLEGVSVDGNGYTASVWLLASVRFRNLHLARRAQCLKKAVLHISPLLSLALLAYLEA